MAPFLILHGYLGSGPEHWQTWLAGRLRAAGETVAYPTLPEPDAPTLPAWREALGDILRGLPEEPVVLAHSLGGLLWLHHCAEPVVYGGHARRVLLVAPPSQRGVPAHLGPFFPVPLDRAAVHAIAPDTRLVYAPDDPYCPEGAGRLYGEPLDLPVDVLPGGGHVTSDTGFGPWPELEAWCYGASAIASSRIAPG